MRLIAATAVTAVLLAGGGCTVDRAAGDDEAVSETEGATPDGQVVVEGEDVEQRTSYAQVLPYVKALASQDLRAMRLAQEAAADKSAAETYMSVQADIDEAGTDAGYGRDQVGSVAVLDADGDGPKGVRYRACFEDDDEASYCYTYADFTVDSENRVESFTVDGQPLAGRLGAGVGERTTTRSPLGNFTLHGAYVTAHGALAVTGVLEAKQRGVVIEDGTHYRVGRAGRVHRNSESIIGAEELSGGEKSAYALYFPGPVRLGGTMSLILASVDGSGAEILEVRVQ